MNHIPKQVLIDKEGSFWIGNDISHLFLFDIKKGTFKDVSPLNKSRIPIVNLYQDKKGVVWVSTDGKGVFLLDKNKGLLKHLQHDLFNPFSLSNNQASEVLEDKNGIFWIATYNTGINKLAISKSSFGHYFYKSGSTDGLSAKTAQSVLEDSKRRIWIGTDGGGLNLFDEKTGTFKHFRAKSGDPTSLSSDKIISISEGNNDILWICTWDGGLNKFDTNKGISKSYQYNRNDPFSIGQNSVFNAKKDSKNRLWLGTSAGLNLFDPVAEKFYHYKNIPGDSKSLISNLVFSLFIDSKNRLFLGTSKGLCFTSLNNIKRQIPYKIDFTEIKIKNFQGTRVNYITEDYKKDIWVGTDMGLYELDSQLRLKKSYSTSNGLPNNLIVGIQEDDNRNLWITSKGGLTYFNPKTRVFKNFNTHDGLQGTEFQGKSIAKTHDGRHIAGGINGFNIFNPKDISIKTNIVSPIISEIRLFDKQINTGDTINGRILLNKSISSTKEINLKYNEGYISFSFIALNYKNPDRVKYAYKMDGLGDDFINAGNNRMANYSNLEPGTYTFEVIASIDGQWDQAKKSSIVVKVQSPPWKTWWAYMLYLIIFVFILTFSIHYYTKKVREEKEQELDKMKLNFFINVSHEFRTPLTLILNPIDKILSTFNDPEEVKKAALVIQRSSRRLLHLVNQLLDLRKMDLGKNPLETSEMDIVKFNRDIFLLFEDLAKAKGIHFVFNAPKKQLYGMFDSDKIEKIVTNLLSNSLKFTDKGGEVTLSIHEVMIEKEHTYLKFFKRKIVERDVEIRVADTGIGLKKEQLNEVFQRFFHADSSKSGTGIGLNFIKSLVELHQGEILVESEYEVGSTFIVRLPADLPLTKSQSNLAEVSNYELDRTSFTSAEYEIAITNEEVDNETVVVDKNNLPVVLIVEDNKELRNHLKNELSNQFQVKEAANGFLGLKMIKKFYPDIVISDVMMPEMDGFEMCRQAKNNIETSHVPIILLTARSLEEDRIEGYDTGADEYLSKPFYINVLKARIRNLLEARKRAKERFASLGVISPGSKITTNSKDEAFLDKTTKIVINNISDLEFSLEDIISELGIGRSQFYRKISSITGQNPSNFIRTVRLKYASELLLTQKYTIKELSVMCGFNSSPYFTKTFRELYGMTPTQFIVDKKGN